MDWRETREGIRREGLFAPLRSEPVALTSGRPAEEVLGRIEAWSMPVRTPLGWFTGPPGLVRKGGAERLRLAVRRPRSRGTTGSDGGRPRAVVRIEPHGGGAAVTGTIGPEPGMRVTTPFFAAVGLLMAVGFAVAGVVAEEAGAVAPAVFGLGFCAVALGLPWRCHGDRATLRAVLADACGPPDTG